jgi:hypothetical protein
MNEELNDAIFAILEKYEIVEVVCNYDGSGDSGCFDSIEFTGKIEDETVMNENAKVDMEVFTKKLGIQFPHKDFTECLFSLAENVLENEGYGGWENNDGAFGNVTFVVDGRKAVYEHNARFMDYNQHEGTLKL